MFTLMADSELQEWMFKDFNYSAWLWASGNSLLNLFDRLGTNPYKARQIYVALTDRLLRKIPGPHQQVMDTWPKWSQAKSPPVLEDTKNNYPNAKWKPPKQVSKPKAPVAPKIEIPETEPVISKSPEGPTLREQPVADPPTKEKLLEMPVVKESLSLEALPQSSVDVPTIQDAVPNVLPGTDIEVAPSNALKGPIRFNTLSIQTAANKVGDIVYIPMVGQPELLALAESDDGISTVSEEPSLDLDAAMAGINGIY